MGKSIGEKYGRAAKQVVKEQRKDQAAIASEVSAELYGLKILKNNINYSDENSTRFIIVGGKKIRIKGAQKVSICFETAHESGSLYRMLSHFMFNNLNMVKIESRPMKDKSFEYRFLWICKETWAMEQCRTPCGDWWRNPFP